MAYVWVDEPEEGADVRDVVAREDYDQIVTERDGLIEQRDTLITRAETAEQGWRDARNKYADAFITSPQRMKEDQNRDVSEDGRASTFAELFRTKGTTVPTKPTSEVINAAKVKLDPREVLEVVINETPAMRDDLLKAGLVKEVED